MSDQKKIVVIAEQQDDSIHPITFELLGKATELSENTGAETVAIIIGSDLEEKAQELAYYGADTVYMCTDSALKDTDLISYRHNVVTMLKELEPEVVLMSASHFGRTIAPRLSVALNTGLSADCIDLQIDDSGNIVQIRPAFSASVIAHMINKNKPVMATIRYKTMQSNARDTSKKGNIIKFKAEIVPSPLETLQKRKLGAVNIADADIIISGGRGLKKADDFSVLSSLAETCGGVIGSSRPLVDDGWIGKEHQVGFSGNTVKPKIYIACGISGSSQHLAGMRNSDIIIAINTDPSAPVFKVADYGIIGDLYEVVPKLIQEIKGRIS
jgi:electron transfer flavoprotein alpha subunit